MNDSTIPCPHCGADIRADANFCRHCGSSDADGWRESYDTYDSEDDDFDYEEFVSEEFGTGAANTKTIPIWRLVAILLLLLYGGYLLMLI